MITHGKGKLGVPRAVPGTRGLLLGMFQGLCEADSYPMT